MKIIRPTHNGAIRNDNQGSGVFGAPRIGRKHRGTDYRIYFSKEPILAPISGIITRKLQVYPNDKEFVGFEIKGENGVEIKIFYVEVEKDLIGEMVSVGDIIGFSQDISKKYGGGMRPHVHMEVRVNGELLDPEVFIKEELAKVDVEEQKSEDFNVEAFEENVEEKEEEGFYGKVIE